MRNFLILLVPSSIVLGVLGFSSTSSAPVQIYDDVLPSSVASNLHEAAKSVGLGHRAFSRPLRPRGKYNYIEIALDSLLSELESDNDASEHTGLQFVEYWSRQEWRSIEAHADVDEFRAKEEDALDNSDVSPGPDGFRYPKYGHVLYLSVGSKVRGPTCVFPNRRSGGDLLRELSRTISGEEGTCTEDSRDIQGDVELVIVPARPMRLLRFPGSALHAVPRPHDLWMLPFVKGSQNHSPEEEWGRSVILFNVWEGEAPRGVSLNEGEGHEDDNDDNYDPRGHDEDSDFFCNNITDWLSVPIENYEIDTGDIDSSWVSAKVWLLGDRRRRDHMMRTIKLSAPNNLENSLGQKAKVTRVWMDNGL